LRPKRYSTEEADSIFGSSLFSVGEREGRGKYGTQELRK
jgi:hypothetical protein